MNEEISSAEAQRLVKEVQSQIRNELQEVRSEIRRLGEVAEKAESSRRATVVAVSLFIGVIAAFGLWATGQIFWGIVCLVVSVFIAYSRRFASADRRSMGTSIEKLNTTLEKVLQRKP